MFRKIMIATAAAAALGAAALSPTAASAGWHGGHWGGGFRGRWGPGPFFNVGVPTTAITAIAAWRSTRC